MLKAQQLTLAVLVNAALISTAFASEQSESKGFVEDAEGSVLFRTGYIKRDKQDVNRGDDTSSFAQSAIVKLESGFTQGVVGFGANVVGDGSFKIGENKHAGNGMIPRETLNGKENSGDTYDHWHAVAQVLKLEYQILLLNTAPKFLIFRCLHLIQHVWYLNTSQAF